MALQRSRAVRKTKLPGSSKCAHHQGPPIPSWQVQRGLRPRHQQKPCTLRDQAGVPEVSALRLCEQTGMEKLCV